MAISQQLGTLGTLSTPCFYQGTIWFQGTDNKLMAMPMDDPSKAFNVGGLKTLSEVAPVQGGRYMAFRGEDDKMMLVTTYPPYLHGQVANEKCLSAPVPCRAYLYYHGLENTLSRRRIDRDKLEVMIVENQQVVDCVERPAISERHPDRLYFKYSKGAVSRLYSLNFEEPDTLALESNGSSLYTDPDGNFWCIQDGKLTRFLYSNWQTQYTVAHADPIRPCMAPYGNDNFIYYVLSNDLYRIPKTATTIDAGRELLANYCATSPDVQPGFVLFGGTDKKIYKLPL